VTPELEQMRYVVAVEARRAPNAADRATEPEPEPRPLDTAVRLADESGWL
jgi:hypothetical protein